LGVEQVTIEGAFRQFMRGSDGGGKRAFFHFCSRILPSLCRPIKSIE